MKFNINDLVYKVTHLQEGVVFELKRIKAVTNTCLGYVYDVTDETGIELCFEESLFKLNEIGRVK